MKSVKKQSRKVGVAGGLINQIMGNNSTDPKVGEGATILKYYFINYSKDLIKSTIDIIIIYTDSFSLNYFCDDTNLDKYL